MLLLLTSLYDEKGFLTMTLIFRKVTWDPFTLWATVSSSSFHLNHFWSAIPSHYLKFPETSFRRAPISPNYTELHRAHLHLQVLLMASPTVISKGCCFSATPLHPVLWATPLSFTILQILWGPNNALASEEQALNGHIISLTYLFLS